MNPNYLHVCASELVPLCAPDVGVIPDFFNMGIRTRPEGPLQQYLGVHVPKSLASSIQSNDARTIRIETLEIGGPSAWLLPGHPRYVVTAVTTKGGESIVEVPARLVRARKLTTLAGAGGCLAAAAVLSVTPYAWAGAMVLVASTHVLRSAWAIPSNAYGYSEGHGWPTWAEGRWHS